MENEWSIVWTRTLEGDKEDLKMAEEADKVGEPTATQTESGTDNATITEVVTEKLKGDDGLTFQQRRISEAALDVAERLVSSAGGECAALWTRAGRILRIVAPATPEENWPEVRLQAYKQR